MSANSMQALVFLGAGQHAFQDFDVPEPGPGEVRVKIARAAVCGTDVHKLRRPPERQPQRKDAAGNVRPVISGHEPAGWIESVGPGVTAYKRGDRALLAGVVGCGHCGHCIGGYNTACEGTGGGLHATHDGSNAPYIVLPERNVVPIPDSMSFDTATILTCAGGTAITIVKETDLQGDDTVAIVGLGPVGLSVLLLAKSYGCRVVGVDVNPARLARAKELGLDAAINAKDEDAVAQVRAFADGRGADVVAECAGTARARNAALNMARRRGRVALAGIGEEPDIDSPTAMSIKNDLVIRGIAATPARYFPLLVERVDQYKLPFDQLITHHFPLADAADALALMSSGDCGKIILDVAESL